MAAVMTWHDLQRLARYALERSSCACCSVAVFRQVLNELGLGRPGASHASRVLETMLAEWYLEMMGDSMLVR